MQKDVNRCMVCGKPVEAGLTICEACAERIRAEAVERRVIEAKKCRKAVKGYGQKPPSGG